MDRKEYIQALESIEKSAYALRKMWNLIPDDLRNELRNHGLNSKLDKAIQFYTFKAIGTIHLWKSFERQGKNSSKPIKTGRGKRVGN